MNQQLIESIANAVLYEGYILYPYRPALKNQQRWTFGGIVPRRYSELHPGSDRSEIQTECLVTGDVSALLEIKVRCLHLMNRTIGELLVPCSGGLENPSLDHRPVESLRVGEELYHSWQEAVERNVVVGPISIEALLRQHVEHSFSFPECDSREAIRSDRGEIVGMILRRQEPIQGTIEVRAQRLKDNLHQLTVQVSNQTAWTGHDDATRDEALMQSLVSTHVLLGAEGGEFVSLIDPPEDLQPLAARCQNQGVWPVLVGEDGATDAMLASPIILYDYPQVASESPGDLFDCTEIDEILTLRVMTLTDEEKQAAISVDERSRTLMNRTAALAREQLMGLHGVMRDVSLPPTQQGEA